MQLYAGTVTVIRGSVNENTQDQYRSHLAKLISFKHPTEDRQFEITESDFFTFCGTPDALTLGGEYVQHMHSAISWELAARGQADKKEILRRVIEGVKRMSKPRHRDAGPLTADLLRQLIGMVLGRKPMPLPEETELLAGMVMQWSFGLRGTAVSRVRSGELYTTQHGDGKSFDLILRVPRDKPHDNQASKAHEEHKCGVEFRRSILERLARAKDNNELLYPNYYLPAARVLVKRARDMFGWNKDLRWATQCFRHGRLVTAARQGGDAEVYAAGGQETARIRNFYAREEHERGAGGLRERIDKKAQAIEAKKNISHEVQKKAKASSGTIARRILGM
jgi:hypothetical protein